MMTPGVPMRSEMKSPECSFLIILLLILIGPAVESEMPDARTYWLGSYKLLSRVPPFANMGLAVWPWGT